MKRKILITAVAAALGLAAVPAAFADRYERPDRDYDRESRYDSEYGRGGGDRGRYHEDECEERYVVHFHLDGGDHAVRAKSRDRAYRILDFLRSVGADAHLDNARVVHYEMRGEARIVRYSDEDAHRLARKLEGYGFHAHVDHEK